MGHFFSSKPSKGPSRNYRGFAEITPGGGVFFSASLRLIRSILSPLLSEILKAFEKNLEIWEILKYPEKAPGGGVFFSARLI